MHDEGPPPREHRFSTRAVHPPEIPPQDGKPVAPSLHPSSVYYFEESETFARASKDKVGAGYAYTRWANPTVDALEAAVADLEGAAEAEAFSSGMAAITALFLALCQSGDRVAATRQLYGNTYSLLTQRLPRLGIEASLADLDDGKALERAADGARLLYCETIGNPTIRVADLERLAGIAKDAGIPLIVDNTFASPVLCRPLQVGAAAVIHSSTKFLGGHHDLLGGIVCADSELIDAVRAVARDIGPTAAPFNAWLTLRSLPTLELRVLRSTGSALALAEWLDAHPGVSAVHYPGLPGSPDFERAQRLLGGKGGGTLAFDVAGGRHRAAEFQNRLNLIKRAASLGGHHSLIVHAASITHTQLSPEELSAAGISEGHCRLSVGLEHPEDLIEDLDQALTF